MGKNHYPDCGSDADIEILEGHSIIYFGPGAWDGMWRNRHQLMSRFARKNKVLYVEPVYSRDRLWKQMRRGVSELSVIWKDLRKARVTKEANNLFIYHSPLYIPIFGRFPLDKISWWVWNLLFRRTMKSLGFSKPIIWLSQPNMSYFIGNFDEKLSIYHVVDEYLSYGEMDVDKRTRIEKHEQELLIKADLAIVVSEKLYQAKSIFKKNTYIVSNGVDFLSYDRVLRTDASDPPDISSLAKPVIGYSGLISRRLDMDLIRNIAEKNPDWSLVLMGQVNEIGCSDELKRLREMSNVIFLGNKKIDQVPLYVKAFDICIIPYKSNEQTENLSPLKLYDFMALGKEIVTTNFPVAREFKEVVRIADSPEMFLDCIKESLQEEDQSLFIERRRIAAQNTWEDRVEQLSEIITLQLR